MTYILRILQGGRLEEPRAEPGNGAAVGGGVEGNLAVAPCLASSLGRPVGRTRPPQHLSTYAFLELSGKPDVYESGQLAAWGPPGTTAGLACGFSPGPPTWPF